LKNQDDWFYDESDEDSDEEDDSEEELTCQFINEIACY